MSDISTILDNLNFKGVIESYSEFEDIVESSYEYDCYIILLSSGSSFYYNDEQFNNYDVAYYYDEEWNTITNVLNDDYIFKFQEKYLSVLTTRFFGGDLASNYPNFTQFCKEYLGQCDEGFWKLASKISSFGNVDEMPDDVLLQALSQYAIHFSFHADKIPYFYNEDTEEWYYDNIRHFLRLNKQFNLSKGTPQSLFFLFEMFDGKLILRFPYKQLLKVSDYQPVVKMVDGMIEIDYYRESSYISCRNNDTKDTLFHLHGEDENTGIKWAYYTAILETDLDIDQYSEVVEAVIKPAGVEYFWQQMAPQKVVGVQSGTPDYISIENDTSLPIIIDDIILPTGYEAKLLGRDIAYNTTVDAFEVPAMTTFSLIYQYTGDEDDWKSTTINIYSEGELYIQVEIE